MRHASAEDFDRSGENSDQGNDGNRHESSGEEASGEECESDTHDPPAKRRRTARDEDGEHTIHLPCRL